MISDKVICNGIVNPEDAASGWGEVKDGFENKYVFRGFACNVVDILAFCYMVSVMGSNLHAHPCAKSFAEPAHLQKKLEALQEDSNGNQCNVLGLES